MITYNYKVNMTPGGIPPRCKLGQYDDDWSIVFSLYTDSGTLSIESGTTAKIRGTKRDGLGYSASATINISAGTVTVAGDKQITAVAGDNLFELVLLKGTKELSTANIIFAVEPAAMDAGTLVSDSQVQEILDMSADVIAASANVNTLRGNFAPTYSSSPGTTYQVGDYVMHDNQLYRCTTAITTAETWTPAHWTAVSLCPAVSDLKSDLEYGNVANVVSGTTHQTTYAGITYTLINPYSVKMVGTSTATSFYDFFHSENSFPEGIQAGGTYSVDIISTNQSITLRIYIFVDGDYRGVDWFTSVNTIRVPDNSTGMIIRVGVPTNTTVNETVSVAVWNGITNKQLKESINTVNKTTKNLVTVSWIKGGYSADGTFNASINRATSDLILYPNSIKIEPGMSVGIFIYRAKGYIGKIDADGNINRTAGSWKTFTGEFDVTAYLKKANADMIKILLVPDNGVTITEENANSIGTANCTVYSDKYISFDKVESDNTLNAALLQNPLFPYYSKFEFRVISNADNQISLGNLSNVRCSVVARFDKPVFLTMINPDFSFGIYWYDENDVYHSKLWDTTWEIPSGVDVGIAIRRHEASSNSERIETETPWLYLIPTNKYNTPKDYFLTEIEDTVNKVKQVNTEPGLCFLLSTDQHYMTVQNWLLKYDTITDMVTNMKAVSKGINVDGHIALGDIADFKIPISTAKAEQFGIKDMSYDNLDSIFYNWMRYAMEQLKSVHPNFIYVPGNHDDNRYLNRDGAQLSVSDWDYTPGEMFSYYTSNNFPEKHFNADTNGLDYYIDYPQFRIRIIAIDANYYNPTSKSWNYGYDDATVSWLSNVLSHAPSDFSVLLLSHMSPNYSHNADNYQYYNMDAIRDVMQSFIDSGGDLIGTFYGHSHVDWSATSPWLDISFCCQKLHNGTVTPDYSNMPNATAPDRVIGTASEDCWNIVLIQPTSRKIKVIRFGAGNDETYNY